MLFLLAVGFVSAKYVVEEFADGKIYKIPSNDWSTSNSERQYAIRMNAQGIKWKDAAYFPFCNCVTKESCEAWLGWPRNHFGLDKSYQRCKGIASSVDGNCHVYIEHQESSVKCQIIPDIIAVDEKMHALVKHVRPTSLTGRKLSADIHSPKSRSASSKSMEWNEFYDHVDDADNLARTVDEFNPLGPHFSSQVDDPDYLKENILSYLPERHGA